MVREAPLRQLISFILVMTLGICCSASPQASSTTTKIGVVRFKGLHHFTEVQVRDAINLVSGTIFDKERLDSAMQRLVQSGAFHEVTYTYRPEAGAMSVEFVVKESTKFRRCVFDNFVWMKDGELQAMLQEKIPLYDGSAPEAGEILDEISAALESAAASQHIAGTVGHIQYGRLGDPQWEHLFSIAGPAIRVTELHFTGTQDIQEGALLREGKSLIGRDYSMVECRTYGRLTFPEYYRERGYLKAEIGEPSAQITKHPEGSQTFDIRITYPVKEGLRYQFDGVQWQFNKTYTVQKLDAFLGIRPGEVANDKKLTAGWEAVAKEYGKEGYIEVQLKREAIFDDPTQKVSFQVQVNEGEQYRMGTFDVMGISPELAAKLRSKWRLKNGEVYDASYMSEFFKKELGSVLVKHGNNPPNVKEKVSKNPSQRTVDVTLQLE